MESSFKRSLVRSDCVVRSYQRYYTGSHQNSAVKRAWARTVLGWVTSREVLVLHPSFSFMWVKNGWATRVLGWVTSRELMLQQPFFLYSRELGMSTPATKILGGLTPRR